MRLMAGYGVGGWGCLNASCNPANKNAESRCPEKDESPLVVRAIRPEIINSKNAIEEEQADRLMLDLFDALSKGQGSIRYLQHLFDPSERIGIKLNCLAGRGLSPRPELVHALIRKLEESGIDPSNIIVFERTERELKKAGFAIHTGSGPKFLGSDSPGAGYIHD